MLVDFPQLLGWVYVMRLALAQRARGLEGLAETLPTILFPASKWRLRGATRISPGDQQADSKPPHLQLQPDQDDKHCASKGAGLPRR
jgi:hypothetical protein